MLNKKILVCGVMAALYMQCVEASDTRVSAVPNTKAPSSLSDLSREELNGRLEHLNNSCPARLTRTACPLIVPMIGGMFGVSAYRAYAEPADECGILFAGTSLAWLAIFSRMDISVMQKRRELQDALKEKKD